MKNKIHRAICTALDVCSSKWSSLLSSGKCQTRSMVGPPTGFLEQGEQKRYDLGFHRAYSLVAMNIAWLKCDGILNTDLFFLSEVTSFLLFTL